MLATWVLLCVQFSSQNMWTFHSQFPCGFSTLFQTYCCFSNLPRFELINVNREYKHIIVPSLCQLNIFETEISYIINFQTIIVFWLMIFLNFFTKYLNWSVHIVHVKSAISAGTSLVPFAIFKNDFFVVDVKACYPIRIERVHIFNEKTRDFAGFRYKKSVDFARSFFRRFIAFLSL